MESRYDLLMQPPSEERTGPPNRVFRIQTRTIPENEIIPPHYHDDLEIVMFRGVQGETMVEGVSYPVQDGAIHTAAPHAVHSFSLHGQPAQSRVWVVQVNLEYFRDCIGRFDPPAAQTVCRQVVRRPVASMHNAGELSLLIQRMMQPENSIGDGAVVAGAMGTAYELLQKLQGDPSAGAGAKLHPKIRSIMDVVASHADRPASLDEIARTCALSKFHLCRTFRRQTGMTVNEYLTRMRILRAQHLLAAKDRTVTQVCFECGFESVSYFIAVFSKIAGVTPKQWALRTEH